MATTVLVVDDSISVRRHVRSVLEDQGYAVLEAGDGLEAIGTLRDSDEIDAVLLDLHMPNASGIEVMQAMKNRASSLDIPVMVVTTEADPAVVAEARELGAKGWLFKPVSDADILDSIARLTGG